MCESELEHKYKAFTHGHTSLESSLHLGMTEHLNSEICMRTVSDIMSAQDWIRRSFLYQRAAKNPQRYFTDEVDADDWQGGLNRLVLNGITELKKAELVKEGADAYGLCPTEYGDIMSKVTYCQIRGLSKFSHIQFYIRQATARLYLRHDRFIVD
jgi:ATP-dependent DNA helicase HFM1/MER3